MLYVHPLCHLCLFLSHSEGVRRVFILNLFCFVMKKGALVLFLRGWSHRVRTEIVEFDGMMVLIKTETTYEMLRFELIIIHFSENLQSWKKKKRSATNCRSLSFQFAATYLFIGRKYPQCIYLLYSMFESLFIFIYFCLAAVTQGFPPMQINEVSLFLFWGDSTESYPTSTCTKSF